MRYVRPARTRSIEAVLVTEEFFRHDRETGRLLYTTADCGCNDVTSTIKDRRSDISALPQ